MWLTAGSFLGFTLLVAGATWLITRKQEHSSQDGFFLAGRKLTFPFIAGSLLLTNLSTEQLVGLNGSAFVWGLPVMAWEVMAVLALVVMALWFLPKFLRAGITTVPEYLALRFDRNTEVISGTIFLAAYTIILLPIILYTGAQGMRGILQLDSLFAAYNINGEYSQLLILTALGGIIGAIYAIKGGLESCAVSDTFNGIGLLAGGIMITFFSLDKLGGSGGFFEGLSIFTAKAQQAGKLNSIGSEASEVPFATLFSGILLINVFYWCTNQQIIQRTFGASSLAEGQKGVLLTGLLKLFGPLYLVLPGIIAFVMADSEIGMLKVSSGDQAYGELVSLVLPRPMAGFFAAVLLGAVLSSFNSALNSVCTLFSLGIYRKLYPERSDRKIIAAGQYFGIAVTVVAIFCAPLLASAGGIFNYLQSMNAIYFIPILAVVTAGMTRLPIPARAANWSLLAGVIIIAAGYFIYPFTVLVKAINQYHFVGAVFVLLWIIMLLWSRSAPAAVKQTDREIPVVDMTPWRGTRYAALFLLAAVIAIYCCFAKI